MLGTLTQKKFAETLQKEKLKQSKQKKNIMAPPQDLPISAEMISLIEANINQLDEEGYLSEGVGSILTQPLNSMSVYCPAAAVLDSKFTATKTLSLTNRSKSGTGFGFGNTTGTGFGTATGLGSGFGTGMVGSINVDFSRSLTQELMKTSTTTRKPIDEAKSRLEVFWLQRKAQLAREEGRLMEAKAILDEAIKEHLGTSNYEEARLAEPVLTADPKDAFEMVNNDFAIYDTVAHGNAGKLQRFWLRIYRAKWKSATDIARAYRGFHVRKIIRRIHHLRLQCAKLIQRRFRMHLVRMHRLATMVKVWYKLRKDVKAFQRKLFRFQMARKIQCLFRGNKGRAIAYERKVLISSVHRVQRNSRGYTQRRDRAAALRWYHKIFYTAARRIQCLVRRVQAVHRAQMKLLIVLSNENIRYRKERLVVEETLRMKRLHNTFYADTHPGKLHLRDIRRQVRLKQMKRKSRSAALSEEEQATDFVISIAEQYDEEGTGYFSSIWLKKVLARLNIYVDKHQLSYLIGILDHEDKGMINISEFIDWYNSEDADYFVEPEDFVSLAAKRYLQARNTAKNVLQLVDPSVRLRRELNRISSTSTINDTVSTFRMRHPPKYQCCQCLSPFALFTDYFLHFSKKGICPTTGLKGLYFRKYWIQQDWTKQRALEAETIRANVEFSLVNEAAKRKCYGELVENKDKMLKKILKKEYQLAYGIIQDKIGLTRTMDEVNVGIQTVLLEALSINTSSKLHTLLMDIIAEEYQLPLRIDLTIEEDPLTIEEGRLWIKKYFPVNKLKAKAVDFTITDDFNTRDTSAANTKSQEKISDKNLHRNYIDLCNNVVERNTIWKTVKKKLLILSKVYVEILRLLQIEAQASLYALIEFRSKRPRK